MTLPRLTAGGFLLGFVCICWAPRLLAGQENLPRQDAPPPPAASRLEALPVNAAVRAKLQEAVAGHHYLEAEQVLIDALKQNPRSQSLLTFLGGIYFLDGDCLQAAVALKKAEKLGPLENGDRFTLAMAYVILKRSDWAQPELAQLEQSAPKNPLFPYWLGRIDYDARRYDSAVRRFETALDLDPEFMNAYDNLALCYEALAKYDPAIRTYQRAIELNRKKPRPSPWPPLNLANLLIKMGRLEEARGYVQESLDADPHFAKAHYSMGVLLEKEQSDQQAIGELNRSLTFDANLAESYYALARIYARDGEKTKAQEALAEFEKLRKPTAPPALH